MNKSSYYLFLAPLLAVCAGLATSSCSKAADQSSQRQRDSLAALLDAYVNGYKTGDWGKVHFAADVTF